MIRTARTSTADVFTFSAKQIASASSNFVPAKRTTTHRSSVVDVFLCGAKIQEAVQYEFLTAYSGSEGRHHIKIGTPCQTKPALWLLKDFARALESGWII